MRPLGCDGVARKMAPYRCLLNAGEGSRAGSLPPVRILRLVRFLVIMTASIATLAGALAIAAPHAGRFAGAHVSEPQQVNLNRLSERSYMFDRYGNKMNTV